MIILLRPAAMGRRIAWLLAALILPQCFAKEFSGFTSTSHTLTNFKTEPTFKPEVFDIQRIEQDRSRLAPGYLFMDMIWQSNKGWGPQIYTVDGTLIWQGPSHHHSQNFHVCDFVGAQGTHLCYSMRDQKRLIPETAVGTGLRPSLVYTWNRVVDQSYQLLEPHFRRASNQDFPLNPHAFETIHDGYSSISLYDRPEKMDLSEYGGLEEGWVRNQCFEEVDLQTTESVFHWCYLQSGLEIRETQMYFNGSNVSLAEHPNLDVAHVAGEGTVTRLWDFLHFNSVDKNTQGDYYVCARHLDQIIKIAGPDSASGLEAGTILWQLGGRSNNFTFSAFPTSSALPFSRAHDVRSISASGTEEVISLLNNAWEGLFDSSQSYSDAQFIHINTETMTATLLRSYPHPQGTLSSGRGSARQLPNGNVLVGWGIVPEFTEYDANGTILYHARFKRPTGQKQGEFSYRVLKALWTGKPDTTPKLVAEVHRRSKQSKPKTALAVYVSWNGATEVTSWRFSVSDARNGPWSSLGAVDKAGFETQAELSLAACPPSHIRVEGLDANGTVLGSAITKSRTGFSWTCRHSTLSSILAIFAIFLAVEIWIYMAHFGAYCVFYGRYQDLGDIPVAMAGEAMVEKL